jgi:hypothetical protein
MAYLGAENMPYNKILHYRAGLLTDAFGYVNPWSEFQNELVVAKRFFDAEENQEVRVYLVTSAGISTKWGEEGQMRALKEVDRWIHEIIWQNHGRVKVTLFADHGHSYTPGKRIPLEKHLQTKGWRIRNRLDDMRDVVYIRFGLETYASFFTKSPANLAIDLAKAEGVELASYAEKDSVVVLSPAGRATIRSKNGRYDYSPEQGDPLKLKDLLSKLTPDKEGYFDADDLLSATIDAEYPIPLQRLWRAHHGSLARHKPDVIISLANAFFSGSESFRRTVKVASTHGSLNNPGSVTFIMSTAGPMPPVLRSREIPQSMQKLLGTDKWPQ